MQLIRNKKELLGREVLPQRLTFYHHQTKNLAKNILPIHQKHTFASEMIFILSKP